MKGDCLSCIRLGNCSETSLQKVLEDYTCLRYEAVEEAIYKARTDSINTFGIELAIVSMLNPKGDMK